MHPNAGKSKPHFFGVNAPSNQDLHPSGEFIKICAQIYKDPGNEAFPGSFFTWQLTLIRLEMFI